MSPVNIADLSSEEFVRFLDSFDHVMSDCDGVLWHYHAACPGAQEVFGALKALGKRVTYVSNNSGRDLEAYQKRFHMCGIQDGAENLVRPTEAIVDYLKSQKFDKTVFCVSNQTAVRGLEKHGIKCKVGPSSLTEDGFEYYLRYIRDDPAVGAVLFDGDWTVNFVKLLMAATYLRRPDVLFLSGPTDKEVPLSNELSILGVGQFCDMVAQFTRREPVVLAKPGRPFAEFLMRHLHIQRPDRVLFIGDMMEQDVGVGRAAGFQTLLVLGTQTERQMSQENTNVPDYYVCSLLDFAKQLDTVQKNGSG